MAQREGEERPRLPGLRRLTVRISAATDARSASRALWAGLRRYNLEQGGPFRYKRTVLCARDDKGRLLGGLISQSYWLETYVELLWISPRARGLGIGTKLIVEAERRARRRGSRVIHLNTFSFQAPGFYRKQGYRCFGRLRGSPKGESRHFYAKRLRV